MVKQIKKYLSCAVLLLSQLFLSNTLFKTIYVKGHIEISQRKISTAPDSIKINLNSFAIFSVDAVEFNNSYRSFISLSDIYQDSLSVPPEILLNQKKISFEKLKRIELPTSYREKLLAATGFKENDTLFLYRYKTNSLEKIPIKNLKAVAHLSIYTSEGENISNYDYQVGFELNKITTSSASLFTELSFAYFGKENPFAEQQLKTVKWKKIPSSEFPDQHKDHNRTASFHYESADLNYYLQDIDIDEYAKKRILTVQNKKRHTIFKNVYDNQEEGSELVPVNAIENTEYSDYLWTGILFKGKPPVIFDLVYHSFGCPEIIFLDQSYPRFFINCDNRH